MDTYEKKYKEALERARIWKDKGGMPKYKQGILDDIFPELKENKESDDERIRKALIRFHKSTIDIDGIKGNEIVAWLEKQGEKKPQRMISAEAKEAMYDKPAWSEEDELVIKDIEEAITNYWHGYTQGILLDWLKSLKQRIKGE